MTGFYVSVRDGTRYRLLAGPYATLAAAEEQVPAVRDLADALDPRAAFYGFGTCKVNANALPAGRLNDRLTALDREARA